MSSRRAATRAVIVIVLLAATQWFWPRMASADITDAEWAERQGRMDYWTEQMIGPRDSNEAAELPWFSSLRYDLDNKIIRIYTSGYDQMVSQDVINAAAADGYNIIVANKPKSLQQMLDEQRALSDQMEADGVITGPNTISLNPTSANQGLTVTTNGESLAEGEVPSADSDEEAAELYGEYLTDKVGADVEVVLDENKEPERTTRQNDRSPWYGGAGVLNPVGSYCSTGFGARKTVLSTTYFYMITAWHCGAGTYKDRSSAKEVIGTTVTLTGHDKAADVASIRVTNGSAGNMVYDGAWNNSAGYAKYVAARGAGYLGSRFCTSGANSGVHCGLKVYKVNARVKYSSGQIVYGLAMAENTSGGIAVAQGDSGGPVFGPHNKTWTKVAAIGIISGGDTPVACPSLATSAGVQCLKNVYFQPVQKALDLNGMTLNTG